MIKLVLYQSFKQIDEFTRAENLLDFPVLTPSPQMADKLLENTGLQTQTLPNFLQLLATEHRDDHQVLKKSDALWHLGLLWSELYPNQPLKSFLYHYHLLSELRSMSLDPSALSEIFSFYPNEEDFLRHANKILSESKLLDEAKLNQLLRESTQQKLIFWGFSQMNGIQVDALNYISNEKKEVYIFIPKEFKSELSKSDWVSWLEADFIELKGVEVSTNFQWIEFPRYRLNESLEKLALELDEVPEVNFLKQPDLTTYSEIPWGNQSFQSEVNIFEEKLNKIKQIFQKVNFTKKELNNWINQQIKLNKKDFLYLRILFEIKDKLRGLDKEELSNIHQDLLLLYLSFSLPRVKASNFVKDLKTNSNNKVYCLTKGLGNLSSGFWRKEVKLESFLMSLGPLPNLKLDLILSLSQINNQANGNIYLLSEQGLIEEDLELNQLVKKYDFKKKKLLKLEKKKRNDLNDYIFKHDGIKNYSATKLQSFIDCPRKYAHLYIEKEGVDVQYLEEIEPRELGNIEHQLIKLYCEKYDSFNIEKFKELLDSFYYSYKEDNGKKLSAEREMSRYLELQDYSKNGILFYFDLKKEYPEVLWSFEEKISNKDNRRRGSVDLYGKSSNGRTFIFDFKRSAGGIAKSAEVTNFRKIQLLFYLNSFDIKDRVSIGYICLEDTSKSWVYDSDFNFDGFDFKNPTSRSKLKWEEALAKYPKFEQKLIEEISNSEEFLPNPVDIQNCKFCSLRSTCNKGDSLWS